LYPEQAGKISSAREIVLLTQMVEIPGLDEVRKMAMHDKLMQRIGRHKRNKTFRKILLWVAAVLVFVLMPLTILQLFLRWPGSSELHETSFGQRKVISLPDRSKVELNANSVLKVGDQWSTGIREVWLEGEAYFQVEKIPAENTRFIVHTTGPDVVVLGTHFNVNSRNDSTSVFLEEGKVTLILKNGSNESTELLLSPGELAQINHEEPHIVTQTAEEAQSLTSWKSGYRVYKDATLQQVIRDINNTYGKQVELKDKSLLSRRISGAIPTDDLSEFIKVTELLFGLKSKIKRDQIVFE
ncbi:MAG: FecR domain-containing protein, partial [Saprospiraceae bacterium]|nr:FecR domain-containing protein [Saprospiraceae bacterium]